MHRVSRLAAVLVLAGGVTACQEDLRGGGACPIVCPDQTLAMRDTVLEAIVLDSTLLGFPPPGSEQAMLLVHRPDTVSTAVVVRFDQVPREYSPPTGGGVQPALSFDSAALVLRISERVALEQPVTFQLFDVDTLAPDLDLDAVRAQVRPERLIMELSYAIEDTIPTAIRFELDAEEFGDRILDGQRLRFAVRVLSPSSIQFRVLSSATASTPLLELRPVLSTGPVDVDVPPSTVVPPDMGPSISEMSDYTLVLQGTPPSPPELLVIGGLPGRRVFMRFEIPAALADTTTVVRAALLLTQVPNSRVGPMDSVSIFPRAVLAHPRLEPGKAALLLSEPGQLGLIPVRRRPIDDGLVSLDMAQVVRQWRSLDTLRVQRALVLQAGEEGLAPQELHFYSTEAADPAVRPRLRITYIPRSPFGLPQ